MITHRLVKGAADVIHLNAKVSKAELRGGGVVKPLAVDGKSVIIAATDTLDFPVPKEIFGELDCIMVTNGRKKHAVILVADSTRPQL